MAQGNSLGPGRNLIRPGCLITVATGMIAKKYGPGIGGLFLAFPAILPASATLIEKHEKQKEEGTPSNARVDTSQASGRNRCGRCRDRKYRASCVCAGDGTMAAQPQTWDRNGRVDPQLDDCLLAHLADKKTNVG